MAGSMRRHKKNRTKTIKKGNHKAKFVKSKPPTELAAQRPDMQRKLGVE